MIIMFLLKDDLTMVKAMLKLSKAAYVIGLLSICKIWVKSRALNIPNPQAGSWN